MTRIIKMFLEDNVLSVLIDLVALDETFGERSREVLDKIMSRVEAILLAHGGRNLQTEEGLTYVKVKCKINPRSYGYVERSLISLEDEVRRKLGLVEHLVAVFRSTSKLSPYLTSFYEVSPMPPRSPEGYRVTSRIARILSRERRVIWGEYGLGVLGYLVKPGVSIEDSFKVYVGDREYTLNKLRDRRLNFNLRGDREFFKKIVDRGIRRKFRELGFRVRGYVVVYGQPIYSYEYVDVWPACEFQTIIDSDGTLSLALSPRHIIESMRSVMEDYESLEELVKRRRELVGCSVRSTVDGQVYRIVSVLDKKARDSFEELNGSSLCEFYRDYNIDPMEPAIIIERYGFRLLHAPSLLRRIYSPAELASLGVAREVMRAIKLNLLRWSDTSRNIVRMLSPIEIDGIEIRFSDQPEVLEVA
ncbi:MAG: hypothetical protein DRJ32_02985 [Thermoprotei archaeon]|nr:MAG: hypothetical protein DRJ32_02985 [Thermoprotei archaeon]